MGEAAISRPKRDWPVRSTRSNRSEFIITRKEEIWCVKAAPMGPSLPVAARITAIMLTAPANRKIFCHAVVTARWLTSNKRGSFSSECGR